MAENYFDQEKIDRLREQAVLDVRNGQANEGLIALKKLLEISPNSQKVIADYIVVAKQQNKFSSNDFDLAKRINFQTYPQYAQLATIKSFRDLKQFDTALMLVDGFIHVQPDTQLDVLKAVLLAENMQKKLAIQQLAKIKMDQLTIDQQVQVAYAYRVVDMQIEGLETIQKAFAVQPDSVAVQHEYLLALMANGSYNQVLTLVQERKSIDPDGKFYNEAYLGDFSQKINEAIKNQKYLSQQGETDNESFTMLDSILASTHEYQKSLTPESAYYLKFYYNYIYALSYRDRHSEAIQLAESLNTPIEKMPAFVKNAIADSYLALKQPQKAETIYKSLLKEKNYADMKLYTALYYSLIEQEKYKEANQLVNDIDKLLPTYQYSEAKGAERHVHPDRAEYIGLKETANSYSNRMNLAEKNLTDIVAKAPNNDEYINLLARTQRWREKPLQAERTLSRLNGIKPESKATLINRMQNAQALGDIAAWRYNTQNLNLFYPTDTSITKSLNELNDRNHATISHQTRISKSESDQQRVLENLKGTRDFETTTRINSPWIKDHYRAIAEYGNREGNYRAGDIREQRLSVGAQWEKRGKSATVLLSQDLDRSDRTGVRIDWDHRLNDHWQYNLDFNSMAAIPLQALKLGEKGKSYGMGINWKQNESRQAGFGYQITDITDGNLRQEISANYSQNVYSSAHHTTRAGVSTYFGHNSLDQTSYFSPKRSLSAEVNLSHDWLTWRRYEKSFIQKFSMSAGAFHQTDYGTKPVLDLQYRHKWQINRLWGLQYGVGWSIHPYDGEREKQFYGTLGFEGRF
ncbi:poly-beta-1,6 N-acetyl-D-glucosamine export porin PgaA [Acinetobacter sp. 194]|uniref:poly-beta-1,6 N-acetyl-D-glucosamine export porin PgaA n=1 Tax=Acinetobacter shaoyimingii TaxID=2715164 RepID=UPI0014078A04|nr:poly-beta-1,6 N-acetyl-D-glucosamine export porin PgaA [Acinetobacter shaoyimingii]NHB57149.1 poly-beta-1,6 N-acetyl-D-glucosamine export porin PgaA [Acinetobacter shaoyimingii]